MPMGGTETAPREAQIKPDSMLDDNRRKAVAAV
jgi:hypothetical protein